MLSVIAGLRAVLSLLCLRAQTCECGPAVGKGGEGEGVAEGKEGGMVGRKGEKEEREEGREGGREEEGKEEEGKRERRREERREGGGAFM